MLLNRRDKEQLVIKLHQEGKTIREIGRQASYEMEQQAQAYEAQQQQAQQQIEAQQRQIEALQRQKQQQPQPHQEDLTQKLIKYAELKKQGILTEEEFQKLKMDLLSKL